VSIIELNRKPSPTDLRWFGFILVVFFGILGTVAWLRFGRLDVAWILWPVGVGLATVYFAVRPLRIPMYLGWMRLFFPLGWTISHAVLLVLYFFVVTPIGLVMRVMRYDPMARRLDPGAPSYWVEHRTGGDPARYLRQF
jgi:hypothetical protein